MRSDRDSTVDIPRIVSQAHVYVKLCRVISHDVRWTTKLVANRVENRYRLVRTRDAEDAGR